MKFCYKNIKQLDSQKELYSGLDLLSKQIFFDNTGSKLSDFGKILVGHNQSDQLYVYKQMIHASCTSTKR